MTGSLTVKNSKYYAVLNVYENSKRKTKRINSDDIYIRLGSMGQNY